MAVSALLGSVSHALLRASELPVTVIPARHAERLTGDDVAAEAS